MERAVRIMQEVSKALIGKNDVIGKVMLGLLAKGHILLEDMPGVGKTTLALALSRAVDLSYKRVQFTPDTLPSDVTGFSIYNKHTGAMEYQPGAVLCNLFLADELNRANSRTQACLLEAMEEEQVTVDGVTRKLPSPFIVIATQNPVGAQGTQMLPDSELDRFMARLSIGYPSVNDEVSMLKSKAESDLVGSVEQVADVHSLLSMQEQVRNIYVNDRVYEYIVRLVDSTRNHELIRQGASPRASIAVMRLSQAYAFLSGRDYVVPQDVKNVFRDAVAHRIILSRQATARNEDANSVITALLQSMKMPGVGRCVS